MRGPGRRKPHAAAQAPPPRGSDTHLYRVCAWWARSPRQEPATIQTPRAASESRRQRRESEARGSCGRKVAEITAAATLLSPRSTRDLIAPCDIDTVRCPGRVPKWTKG